MEYQLVIQFEASSTEDFGFFLKFENRLIEKLKDDSEVDGHDFGTAEMNVFVFTNHPDHTVVAVKALASEMYPNRPMKIGYRKLSEDYYAVLWPPGLTEFKIA